MDLVEAMVAVVVEVVKEGEGSGVLSRKASPRTLTYPLVPEYRRHVLV